MGDLSQSPWLLRTIWLLPKAELVEIAKLIPEEYHQEGAPLAEAIKLRKTDLCWWIEDCRQSYWGSFARDEKGRWPTINAATRAAKRTTTSRSVTADLCEITAAECNAWLRSLPGGNG